MRSVISRLKTKIKTKINKKVGIRSPILGMVGVFLVAGLFFSSTTPSYAKTARIKDIVNIEGVRENQLVGYGLVVGLNGTGDSLGNSPFTQQSLIETSLP